MAIAHCLAAICRSRHSDPRGPPPARPARARFAQGRCRATAGRAGRAGILTEGHPSVWPKRSSAITSGSRKPRKRSKRSWDSANRRPLRGAFIIPPPQGAVADCEVDSLPRLYSLVSSLRPSPIRPGLGVDTNGARPTFSIWPTLRGHTASISMWPSGPVSRNAVMSAPTRITVQHGPALLQPTGSGSYQTVLPPARLGGAPRG